MKKKVSVGAGVGLILILGFIFLGLESSIDKICKLHEAESIPYETIDGLIDPWFGEPEEVEE